MYLDRISAANSETRLITRDALAVSQWEAVAAYEQLKADSAAWPSRQLHSVAQWLRDRFETAQTSGFADRHRLLLTPGQTEALWQQVIQASDEGQALISSHGVGGWARAARRSLFDAGLTPNQQGGPGWHDDAAAFLSWNRRFERELKKNGWLDADALLFEISQLAASAVGHDAILLDLPPPSPALEQLLTGWRDAGFRIDTLAPDDHQSAVRALVAGDSDSELELAANWAADALEANADSKLAVVVADLNARRGEVERIFSERLGSDRVTPADGPPVGNIGVFGAALTALELLSGDTDFDQLSRWLRSPFFARPDANGRRGAANIELALRSDPRAQQDFAAAWHRHGLKGLFERSLPGMARQLDQALDRLPRRATPTTWTRIWQSCLETLGWQGFMLPLPEAMHNAWESAWAQFSALTPIVGAIDGQSALADFERIVLARTVFEPMPLSGVHLLQRIDQIGPGYSGVWITGFSDEAYPLASHANPLLPWRLQADYAMPGANPDLTQQTAREELARLSSRVPETVFSCPGRLKDQPLLPNPLITGWLAAVSPSAVAVSRAARRIGARAWETRTDQAPPLALPAIPGGTRTLDLQARSPVKAFCVARLKAEPLELPARGIDARLKGLLVHRALEVLLDPDQPDGPPERIDRALNRAFAELVRPGNACWDAQVLAERTRIETLIATLLERESARDAFAVIAVERRTEIDIGGHQLRCRIDRIDQLDAGGELLIDYKTGQSVGADWFATRLGDCQLPIYAQAATEVAGIATIRLAGNEVEYRGAGRKGLSLPGRIRSFDADGWRQQLDHWCEQLAELVDEFARGDVRIRSDARENIASHAMEHTGGAFAPLTRVGDPQ